MADNGDPIRGDHETRHLARLVLFVFLLTFILSRVLVFLIMSRRMPDLYMHMGGTHVHHLNYGIFLLVGVGARMLFSQPQGRERTVCAFLYAIGLALTFDEFGMWLHLGGGYWQRASFDAVTVVAAVLALIAYAPSREHWSVRHAIAGLLALGAVGVFAVLFVHTLQKHDVGEKLQQLEQNAPQ